MSIPRILVIGGTGFLGSHLLERVQSMGWDVTSVSLHPPTTARQAKGVRYLHFDITDFQEIQRCLSEEFEYVVNLGGYIDHTLFCNGGRALVESHFIALQNLIEVIPRSSLKRFVQIGSSDEYGDSPSPQHEEIREKPISPYSLAKASGTHLLQMLHRTECYPSVILRLFLSYGPGQNSNRFIPQIIMGCLRDNYFPTSSGMQVRDLCYVKDTIDAIVKAMLIDESIGHVINIASGQPITIRKVIEKVVTMVGKGRPNFGELSYRAGENMSLYANTKKAERILDWRPVVSLEEGLESAIQWYAKHG